MNRSYLIIVYYPEMKAMFTTSRGKYDLENVAVLRVLVVLLAAIGLLSGVTTPLAADMTFPKAQWQEASPQSQSLDETQLAAAIDYLRQNSGRDEVKEMVIVRNGRMVWKGNDIDKVHGIWSCTKSFTSTALGLLIEDGKCELDTPAMQFVPDLADHYRDVTLRHFVTMTSGYRAIGDEPRGGYKHGPSSTPFRPLGHPESNFDGRGVYGFNWWTNGVKSDGQRIWHGAPESTYAASGHNNNKLFVIPDWNMVIVRLGLDEQDGKIPDAVWSEFLRLVGHARTEEVNGRPDTAEGETTLSFRVHEIARPGGASFGQTSATDVDQDGDLDLIQAEGDVLDGRVAWFENLHGNGRDWARHLIKQPGHNQDFHSLCVADFDNDGDLDIFSGGGPLTQGEHIWFLWENADGKGETWTEHIVQRGQRTHESVCGDVDGDGDLDILTKPWRGDLHLFVENLLIASTSGARRGAGQPSR